MVAVVETVAISACFSADTDNNRCRPNIVVIITDDQGYGDLSCHGNPILKTPHLDRLYAESVRFTDFHVSPTCSPTRASLMTGRHEFKSGVTHTIFERERLNLSATTLPQVLKSAGYATGIFGKWHLGDEAEYQPGRRGFDESFIHGGGGIGQTYRGSCGDAPRNRYFDPTILHNGKFEKTTGYCTDVFFAEATKWIAAKVKANANAAAKPTANPFFCYIATNAPHTPLDCPAEYEARYTGKAPNADVAKFFGMIANIDDNVGRLLAKLAELGIERDTLVVFMNDNGGTIGTQVFNAGMRAQKVTVYRGGTRGISFWRLPGTLVPGDCDRLAAHIDMLPTLADIAGAPLSAETAAKLDGRSLRPLLLDQRAAWSDRTLFTHSGRWPKGSNPEEAKFANCSIRDPRWNLVSSPSAAGRKKKPGEAIAGNVPSWELYDLQADPGESRNLAGEHPDVVRRLATAYDAWWAEVIPATVENERAVGPAINPFHALYYAQFGGGPAGKSADPPQPAAAPKPVEPAFAPVVDDPKLPRVLLIGDSISIGYTVDVRKLLAGKANVHRIPVNGGPTTNGLAVKDARKDKLSNLSRWLAPDGAPAKWDIIHFNWGLHDLKEMPDGKLQVDPDAYEKNLRELVKQMQATGATLIWCTTTPVQEGTKGPPRKTADVLIYNERAKKVMDEAKVETDDLYTFALPKLKEIQLPLNVHFTPAGSAVLAEKVAAEIEKRLPKK
ncbi:MAG: sulfatase-like hydrolase/transferase [Planctomycetia bacterium]|nr:sulfatase-like hydrolase/transferase [Planctomycetia bacterium]